jgi:hypothetical protein
MTSALYVKPVTSSRKILGNLEKIDRRLQLMYCSDLLAKVACCTLGVSAIFQVGQIIFGLEGPSSMALIFGALVFYAGFGMKRMFEKNRLRRAAGLADELADLSDEIKTAYWFIRNPVESAWIDLQLKRAANSLDKMKPREFLPFKPSKWFRGAFILIGVRVLLALLPTRPPLFVTNTEPKDSFSDLENQIANLESTLERDVGEFLDESDLENLEEVLQNLKSDELQNEELLKELLQAEEILNEGSFGLNAFNQEMTQLSEEVSGPEELSAFANSLGQMDLTEAAQQLRELSANLSNMDPSALNELERGLDLQDSSEALSIEELLAALSEAGKALAEDQMSMAEESLGEAATALDAMAENQSLGDALNEASMNLQSLRQEVSQSDNSSSMTTDEQMEGGASGSGSDEVTKSSGGESGDGSGPAGNSTGDPFQVAELELGDATTLEVQLNLEVIDERLTQENPDPQNLFQGASQRQTSDLQFYEMGGLAEYSSSSALDVETVFWEHRNLVKNYFLGIRPLRKNDN